MHELALELHMTVGELCYGRGTPMSAHEMTVAWPAYYRYRERDRERRELEEANNPKGGRR